MSELKVLFKASPTMSTLTLMAFVFAELTYIKALITMPINRAWWVSFAFAIALPFAMYLVIQYEHRMWTSEE